MSLCLRSFIAKKRIFNLFQEVIGVNQDAQVTGVNVALKSRMRWTQELHKSFVHAVSDLGGANGEHVRKIQNSLQ